MSTHSHWDGKWGIEGCQFQKGEEQGVSILFSPLSYLMLHSSPRYGFSSPSPLGETTFLAPFLGEEGYQVCWICWWQRSRWWPDQWGHLWVQEVQLWKRQLSTSVLSILLSPHILKNVPSVAAGSDGGGRGSSYRHSRKICCDSHLNQCIQEPKCELHSHSCFFLIFLVLS